MNDELHLHNASQFPRIFYCRHMQPGTVGYDKQTILVDTDGVKAMMPSGPGKPVYIHHQTVDLVKIKEQAAGYISESFYNELDGWAWFKFIAVDDRAHKAIADGWSVSNAYIPTQKGPAGTKNNIPYAWSVIDGEFTHLAIVPDPRYEGALIMTPDEFKNYQEKLKNKLAELQNSNPKGKTMFKLFKNSKQEVSQVDGDTEIELENGKSIKVSEMINAVKKNSDDDEKKKKEMENGDQMVDVGGEKMPLKELVNKFTKMNEKKNADDEAKKGGKSGDDEDQDEKYEKKNKGEKKNADDEDDEKKEKKNSANDNGRDYFNELRNANLKAEKDEPMVETTISTLQRGKSRYGKSEK